MTEPESPRPRSIVGRFMGGVRWFVRLPVWAWSVRAARAAGRWALRSSPRWAANRFALAALVCLALAAVYGAAWATRPGPAGVPRPGRTTTPAAVAVCPDTTGGTVSVFGAAGPVTRTTGDVTTIDPSKTQAPATPQAATPSPLTAGKTTSHGGAWIVRSAKGGLAVEQDGPGKSGLRCAEPAADQWFVGPGPDADVFLTDAGDRPVSVVVDTYGTDGPIGEPQGVNIDPGTTGRLRVTGGVLALRVHTVSGRIAASVRVGGKAGTGWLPSTRPGRDLLLPGVPSADGGRRLMVIMPGRQDATARVQVLTSDGPSPRDPMPLPPLAVTSADLQLAGRAAGVRVMAGQPIVAGFVATTKDDFTAGAAARPLTQGGLVASGGTLILTAPGGPATIRAGGQNITVPAGRTIETKLTGDGAALSGGPVYAAVSRPGVLLPVTPARPYVTLPPVSELPYPP